MRGVRWILRCLVGKSLFFGRKRRLFESCIAQSWDVAEVLVVEEKWN
jgi:hypothetical protein